MPSKYRKTLKISHDINDKSIIVKNFCGSTKKEVQVYIYKYKLELLFLITFQDENQIIFESFPILLILLTNGP